MTQNTPEPNSNLGEALIDQYSRWRRRGAILLWIAIGLMCIGTIIVAAIESANYEPPLTVSPTPLPSLTPVALNEPDPSKVGIHFLLDDGRQSWETSVWESHFQAADKIVGTGGIAVQVIRSSDLRPRYWQYFLDLCARYGMTPVLRLSTTYHRKDQFWRTPHKDGAGRYTDLAHSYANFLSALDWHGLTPHVILFNEVNNGLEWGGIPDPEEYARLVADMAPVLRAAVPGIKILNAALDHYAPNTYGKKIHTGYAYMDAGTYMDIMQQTVPGIFNEFDLWNSHPYPLGAFREPPWNSVYQVDSWTGTPQPPAPQGLSNRGINSYEWELWKLWTYGVPPKPVLITETGWRYESDIQGGDDEGEGYPTQEQVAQYFDLAMWGNEGRYPDLPETGWTPWLRDPRVVGVSIFALDGVPIKWGHTNLLNMTIDGRISSTTPMYDVLTQYQTE